MKTKIIALLVVVLGIVGGGGYATYQKIANRPTTQQVQFAGKTYELNEHKITDLKKTGDIKAQLFIGSRNTK